MMKYTKTAIGLLTRQYRSVLKKCWLINVGLFALGAPIMAAMTASDANAAIDAIALNGTTYTSGTAILPTLIESITVNGTTYSGQKAFDMGTLVKSIAFNAGSGVNYVNGAATIGISSANGQITIGGQTIDLGGVLKTTGTTNQTVAGDVKFGSITLGTDSLSSVGTDVIALTNTETTKVATTGAVAKTVKANTVNADYTTLGDGVIGTSGTKVAVGGALDTLNTTLLAVQGTANSAVQDVKLSLNGNTAASIIDANKIANLSFNTGSTPGTIAIGTGGTTTTDVAVKDVLLTTGQTVQSVAGEVDVGSLKVGDSAKLTGTSTAAVGLTDTSVATLVTNKALADTVRTNAEGAKLTVTGSTGHSILVGADRTIGSAINILDQQVYTNQTDITTN
ncbi:MAG: hypothetical protein IKR92_05585, partial [Alphaproteobacteria bacterium]|nr:hypothetical protein [Alphaproteobacteria bacterium]